MIIPYKSFISSRLYFHLAWIYTDYVLVLTLIVLIPQLNILHTHLLALQTYHSHRLRVNLVESSYELVGVFCRKA